MICGKVWMRNLVRGSDGVWRLTAGDCDPSDCLKRQLYELFHQLSYKTLIGVGIKPHAVSGDFCCLFYKVRGMKKQFFRKMQDENKNYQLHVA